MPNSHDNSQLMRVQKDTFEKISVIAEAEHRAKNAQLALIVDEWCTMKGYAINSQHRPARHDTKPPAHTPTQTAPKRGTR